MMQLLSKLTSNITLRHIKRPCTLVACHLYHLNGQHSNIAIVLNRFCSLTLYIKEIYV